MNISDNAMSLFKYIYCVTASQIDHTNVDVGPREPEYVDKVKDAAKKYLGEIKTGDFERRGKNAGGPSLKADFLSIIESNPDPEDREDLIKGKRDPRNHVRRS
jgi:hypothetical protein